MADTITITLAGQSFTVEGPLTLGQLIDLQVAVTLAPASDPQEEVRRGFQRSLDILHAAVPELTAEKMRAMKITTDEIRTAVEQILVLSGLVPAKKDAPPGEAEAGA